MSPSTRSLDELIATRLLEGIARIEASAVLWGQRVPGRKSRRRQFPRVDFYGEETMPSGLLGHKHAGCEVAFVVTGRLNVCIEAQTYEALEDDWMLFLPGVIHGECCLTTKRPYELLWLHGSAQSRLICQLTGYTGSDGYQIRSRRDFGRLPTELLAGWSRLTSRPWRDLDLTRCNLLHLAAFCLDRLRDEANPPTEALHPLVNEVKALLQQDLSRPLSVPQLANEVALSPNYLSSLFHRNAGMTLRQFLDLKRVERAKALLLEPHSSIKQVAFALGYADQHQFSRVFRRVTGTSPTGFRERTLEIEETDTSS
ncbi:MAG: helix-turn-helix transcriptional regulator [Armatimonadetes bacterium]|nr:helix-turn-helix transcriptional regulator [Armatimonadota bacterium]MDI9585319.1 helix-turn-helix domain-containing protein [Acidobacteriota bacterium]